MQLPDRINLFARDVHTRTELQEHMTEYLKDMIIKRAFVGLDVNGLAEAKTIIDTYFASITKAVSAPVEKKIIENI